MPIRSLKPSLLYWLLAIALPLLWLWPRLIHPQFVMIDDPDLLESYRAAVRNFPQWWATHSFHGEPEHGRIKPLALLFVFVFYFLPAGLNPLRWAIIHYIFFALTLSFVFLFINRIMKNPWLALAATALWTLSANTVLSWTRYHIQDPYQSLWLALLLNLAYIRLKEKNSRQKHLLSIVFGFFLFVVYFTKETTVLLLPLAGILFLTSRWKKKYFREASLFFVLNLVFTGLLLYLKPPDAGYTEGTLVFSPGLLWHNAKTYAKEIQWAFLVAAFIGSFITRCFRKPSAASNPIFYWQLSFLMLFALFLSPYLLWKAHVQRYLLVPELFLYLFCALELGRLVQTFPKYKIHMGVLACVLALLSVPSLFGVIKEEYVRARWGEPVAGMRWFAEHAKSDANVLAFVHEEEILVSTATYIQRLFDRPDLMLYSLSPYAATYWDKGYGLIPISSIDRSVLENADYILWYRQGYQRARIDKHYYDLMEGIKKTPYGPAMKKIYGEYLYTHPQIPEGIEIWEMPRARE